MAQDLELFNPAGFEGGPAQAFGDEGMEESLSDGIGGGYPLIRYRGKVWAVQVRGDSHTFVDEKGYPAPFLDIIILRQAQNKSKAYFENYEDGSKDAPVCTSADGIVPDAGVLHKQNETCNGCPRNVFKQNEKGFKSKECSDAKRLAVVPLPEQTRKLLGEPLIEPVFLRVPAASLQNLAAMGDEAKRRGFAYHTFVTRVDFDPEKSFPKMRFRAIQRLTEAEAGKVKELRDDPMSFRIIGGEPVRQQGNMIPAGAPVGLIEQPKKDDGVDRAALAAKLEADRLARLAAVKEASAAEEAKAAAAAQAAQTLELQATVITTGLGEGAPTVSSPIAADDAMNAAINALLPKK